MTQIVIDIANAFNENFSSFNLTAIAPSYPYIMYRAGMQMLLSADIPNEEVERDFYAVRRCCWYFSHRWLIAGPFTVVLPFHFSDRHQLTSLLATYVETLESSAGALGISLPYLGEFVRPKGVLPGLC
jgi:hypothetical protein